MDTRTICLGVLTQGEATGYEIKKCIEESFGYFLEVSHSSIYPALAELYREGLVSCEEVRQAGRPDKKVYSLTEPGRRAFLAGLRGSPGRHKVRSEFVALLLFAEYLPPQRLETLLDSRLEEFERLIDYARGCLHEDGDASAGARFAAGLGITMMSAGARYIRDNREALERSLEAAGEAAGGDVS